MNELDTIKSSDCFLAAEIVVGSAGDDSKSAPIELVARSGDAIDHHIWGRVVHDFDGMQHKPRVALDYNHNPDEVVGYANKFSHESGSLKLRGALTPFKDSDRGTEILSKSKQGVPYEASINFAGPMDVERIKEGTAVVNGRAFEAPLTIIRKWHLRGVAICPYGYDHQTQATALSSSDRDIAVTIIEKETTEMSQDATIETPVSEAEVTDKAEAVETTDSDTTEVAEAAVDVQTEEELVTTDLSNITAKDYMAAFGEQSGALYFAKEVPYLEAVTRELNARGDRIVAQDARISELENQLAQSGDTDEPTKFSSGGKLDSNVLTAIPGDVCDQVVRKT